MLRLFRCIIDDYNENDAEKDEAQGDHRGRVGSDQKQAFTTPPSARSAAPLMVAASGLQR